MGGRVHLGLQDTPPSSAWADVQTIVGTWLSLVERTLGVGEVASSNLVVPTIYFQLVSSSKRVIRPLRRSNRSSTLSLHLGWIANFAHK
jgi:hypothetical protein